MPTVVWVLFFIWQVAVIVGLGILTYKVRMLAKLLGPKGR